MTVSIERGTARRARFPRIMRRTITREDSVHALRDHSIRYQRRGRLITLNRPDKLNAFTARMHEELREAMRPSACRAKSLRALLITGSGRGFCAGQDLSERVMTDGCGQRSIWARRSRSNYNPLVRGLRELRMPVICAVNGVAAGAGCNFALACDIVIAARSASFIEVFSRIGLIPDAGGTYVLPRLVGMARAMALSLLAEPISAEQAANWGLIWKCVDDDKLMSEAQRARATPRRRAHARLRPDQAGALRFARQHA